MPQAVATLYSLLEDSGLSAAERVSLVAEMDQVLGLDVFTPMPSVGTVPPELTAMLDERNQARTAKNWGRADELRREIDARGYEICDSPQGSYLKKKL